MDDGDPFDELRRGLRGRSDTEGPGEERTIDVRHLLLGAAGAVVLALAVVVLSAARSPVDEAPPREPALEVADEPVSTVPPTTATASRVWPDEPVEVAGNEVRSGSHRWSVGEAGDVVAVGDWDCNGTVTPAVVRPAANRLYLFDAWATADAVTAASPGPTVPPNVTSIEAKGCGRADVRTSSGTSHEVTTQP